MPYLSLENPRRKNDKYSCRSPSALPRRHCRRISDATRTRASLSPAYKNGALISSLTGAGNQGKLRGRTMRRGWEHTSTQQQQGWRTTSPGDYHDHLSKMIRTPSILPYVPQYPSVHKIFNKQPKVAYPSNEGGDSDEVKHPPASPPSSHGGKHAPQFQEKVEVMEFESDTRPGSTAESIDSRAETYIREKHQKFELCKWATFREHY
ncbi:hypothetical protein SAY86_015931 [Trapa natans]|uniref:Uncharacterized protein n=1 Tax=Trapa natans TaxID=22666 RepID=A0AAN7LCU7_TRANT|nr:hypothetical protein SAY86_015931 [Trapa natans]